jgi:site-specific recombinase XerC
VAQAQKLLNTPDVTTTTTKGLRDQAILALLLGCGLRRSHPARAIQWRKEDGNSARRSSNPGDAAGSCSIESFVRH